MRQSLFKKYSRFQNFRNILLWHEKSQAHEYGCFYTMSIRKNHFKKQKYGPESVKETFKISKLWWNSLWHDQTQEHKFGYFYTIFVNKNYFKKENMGQNLIKKHSKFLNFSEIFYCGMTRLRKMTLNYYGLCQYIKAIKSEKIFTQSLFKDHLKFQNFNIQ